MNLPQTIQQKQKIEHVFQEKYVSFYKCVSDTFRSGLKFYSWNGIVFLESMKERLYGTEIVVGWGWFTSS